MTRTVSKRYTHTLTLTQHCDCDVSQRIFPTVMSSIVNNNIRWCLRVYRVNPPCNASKKQVLISYCRQNNKPTTSKCVICACFFFRKILRNSWLNRLLQIYCVTDVTEHLSVNLSPFLKIASTYRHQLAHRTKRPQHTRAAAMDKRKTPAVAAATCLRCIRSSVVLVTSTQSLATC